MKWYSYITIPELNSYTVKLNYVPKLLRKSEVNRKKKHFFHNNNANRE